MIRRFLLTITLLLVFAPVFSARTTEFFIVAHPDDWQLFMGLDAYAAMRDTNRHVVIIHTTAGDASFKAPAPNRKFYMARERGAIASLEFCIDMESAHTREYLDTVLVNGHPILKFEYNNVVNYFLRLPDGCLSTGLHGQSLEYMKKGLIGSMTAVDSSTTYRGWEDLVYTLRHIMESESDESVVTGLNIADTNSFYNPGDHPDHIYTAHAALAAAANMDNMWKHFYFEYHVEHLPINLTQQQVALKAAIYGVAEYCRAQSAVSNSWCQSHIDFLCRSYYRTIASNLDSAFRGTPGQAKALLHPNPARDVINIMYHLDQPGQVALSVTTMSGQSVVQPQLLRRDAGDYSNRINIASLNIGTYIATIQTPGYQQSFTFTKL